MVCCWNRVKGKMSEKQVSTGEDNPMRKIKIEKVILNICIGDSQDRLTRAATVLEEITGNKPVFSKGTDLNV